jgi:3-carboxy-cis,cis-muconate cycloisomerase
MTDLRLTSALFSSDGRTAIFSAKETVQRMLDVEAALARALEQEGVIPAQSVASIVNACRSDQIDIQLLMHDARQSGNLAIPLVKQLTAKVAADDAQAARHVHWGATSQDIIDTGLVLQLCQAIDLITIELAQLADALASHAHRHRATPMIGRTWMQHALPITFGLKAAGWLDAILRHQERLAIVRKNISVLQFGGAAGSLASLGDKGLAVSQALAHELQLTLPVLPWHTHRDRIAEVGTTLGLLTGTLGKIAHDISLHAQTEIAELSEASSQGRGGSSTMPHKRNSVGCAGILATAHRVPALVSTLLSCMVHEHERALGGWQAEWDTLPDIILLTSGALHQLRDVVQDMTVNTERMRSNIAMTHGLVMAESVSIALSNHLGRAAAHELVEAACAQAIATDKSLFDILQADKHVSSLISRDELQNLVDPVNYLGQAKTFVDRVLTEHRHRKH